MRCRRYLHRFSALVSVDVMMERWGKDLEQVKKTAATTHANIKKTYEMLKALQAQHRDTELLQLRSHYTSLAATLITQWDALKTLLRTQSEKLVHQWQKEFEKGEQAAKKQQGGSVRSRSKSLGGVWENSLRRLGNSKKYGNQ